MARSKSRPIPNYQSYVSHVIDEKFFQLIEVLPDAAVITQKDGTILLINKQTELLLGYKREELVGQSVEILMPERFRNKHVKEREEYTIKPSLRPMGSGLDLYALHKSGTEFPVDINLSPLDTDEGLLIFSSIRDVTERKKAEQKVQKYQQRLKKLASQLTIAEENERRRIAADLHDHVGQSLSLARMQLATLIKATPDSSLADLCQDISGTLLEAIRDTKKLIFELSSPSLNEIGLGAAISEWLEDLVSKQHGLKTEFIDNIDESLRKALDKDIRAILFRNVREVITNVVKHGQAKKVSVRLDNSAESIRITVQDDGVGFDVQEKMEHIEIKGGFGLFSIQERMNDLEGAMEVVSEPGKGCTVVLTAPLNMAHAGESR